MAAPVGRYRPNAFGLYDMLGNVWEWCWDGLRTYDSTPQTDPRGAQNGSRMLRGGSWDHFPGLVRSAWRDAADSSGSDLNVGFRVLVVCGPSRR